MMKITDKYRTFTLVYRFFRSEENGRLKSFVKAIRVALGFKVAINRGW